MRSTNKMVAKVALLGLAALAMSAFAQANVAASAAAPNGLLREQVPQFIVIGSDDNTNADAMIWMTRVMSEGRRHDGTTFSATNQDGSPRRMTFYVNTHAGTSGWDEDADNWTNPSSNMAWDNNLALQAAVLAAYQAGHSIGNHTASHPHFVASGGNMTAQQVRRELEAARDRMVAAGIPAEHQFGFRTPFLAYSDVSFGIVREMGFLYDHSIEPSVGNSSSQNFPYTLHSGSPDNAGGWWGGPGNPENHPQTDPATPGNQNLRNTLIGNHPGLWSLLASNVTIPDNLVSVIDGVLPADRAGVPGVTAVEGGHRLPNGMVIPTWMGTQSWGEGGFGQTGFDFNLWAQNEMNEEQTYNALMHTLRLHLDGNRAPFTFGPHSQYFFQPDNAFPNIDANSRRRAFERFVESASQIPGVFFVAGDQVIRWMQNPQPLSTFNPDDFFVGYGGSGTPPPPPPPPPPPANYIDLIGWEFLSDFVGDGQGFGVSTGTNVTITSQNPLSATLQLDAQEGNDWPWLTLATFFEEGFLADLESVEITYTSSAPIRVAIGLQSTTSNATANYWAQLPQGDGNTVTRRLADFARPSWTPSDFEGPANLATADMATANGITFFHENYGESINITVTQIRLVFRGDGTSIAPRSTARRAASANNLRINGLRAGNLHLNVGQAGMHTISILSVDGRVLSQTRANLTAGVNTVNIGNNIARGVAIVRIEGQGASVVRRISVR